MKLNILIPTSQPPNLPPPPLFSLDAVDPNAYDAFKASRNLGDVIERVLRNTQDATNGSGPRKLLTVEASLMTPVQPMLVSRDRDFNEVTFPKSEGLRVLIQSQKCILN